MSETKCVIFVLIYVMFFCLSVDFFSVKYQKRIVYVLFLFPFCILLFFVSFLVNIGQKTKTKQHTL